MMAVSLINLVDVIPHGRIEGWLRTVIEAWALIDVLGLVMSPLTVPFALYVLIRHWRIGWVRWLALLALVMVRLWSVRVALQNLAVFANWHA